VVSAWPNNLRIDAIIGPNRLLHKVPLLKSRQPAVNDLLFSLNVCVRVIIVVEVRFVDKFVLCS